MPSATLNLRVSPRRMVSPKEAADYCGGVPINQIPVSPVEMPNGKKLYDIRDLDDYLDGLKSGGSHSDDEVIGKLGL